MLQKTKHLAFALGAFAALTATEASAQLVSNSSSYNNPYGMTQANENQAVDPSLRDANGNLQSVNGQFLSCAMCQQSGVQQMGVFGSTGVGASLGSSSTATGAGFSNATSVGTATAMGNSLNVVTIGSNNTVVVDSTQINNGNQTATVNDSGH
jgi:holdfast attachment protein HfaA